LEPAVTSKPRNVFEIFATRKIVVFGILAIGEI